jgi:alginate O-acetyltransferase complex protein AlgI
MLFNSAVFILGFLPLVWIGFFAFGTSGRHRMAIIWLSFASLFFYGWWNPRYVPMLLGSMCVNYALGRVLARHRGRPLLITGIVCNLALLGYCKYAGFLVHTANDLSGEAFPVPEIALPLAISFFTFQQIAFLVDCFDRTAKEADFSNYILFVTFFPHLIAGPITHHKEMMPQFADRRILRPQPDLIALGLTLFLVGLCKKVLLADTMSPWVRPVFDAAQAGGAPSLLESWGAAIGYGLQIYFDFSGYSDMAIGLGMLFGIRLPRNFDSPFKSRNIIEFWSRWHMTLTRFLAAYIFNPLALVRTRARIQAGKPIPKRGKTTPSMFLELVAMPTLITFFLAGLWHGAGWQFIIFGVLHGIYLTINHAWRAFKAHWGWTDSQWRSVRVLSVLTTFLCFIVSLVFFRAASVAAAINLLAGMAGFHGAIVPFHLAWIPGLWRVVLGLHLSFGEADLPTLPQFLFTIALLVIVWFLPSTEQWLGRYATALGAPFKGGDGRNIVPSWRPTVAFGAIVGCICFVSLMRAFSVAPSEFLYFQF